MVSDMFPEEGELDQELLKQPAQVVKIDDIIGEFTRLLGMNRIELREIYQVDTQKFTKYTGLQKSVEVDRVKTLDFQVEKFAKITQDSRMQQQIIPNVNRIKIEKVRALRRLQFKESLIYEAMQKGKKTPAINALTFQNSQDEMDLQLAEQG